MHAILLGTQKCSLLDTRTTISFYRCFQLPKEVEFEGVAKAGAAFVIAAPPFFRLHENHTP